MKLKEPVSCLTHLLAAVLAAAGLVALVVKSSSPPRPLQIVSFSIFGAGMILLYTASTLYHWLDLSHRGERRLKAFDHMMIFVLIAATYTPVCLVALGGGWGWGMFGAVWGLALAGILLKLFWLQAPRWFSTMLYVVLGWVAIVGVWPLSRALSLGALAWLLAGGLFYTTGALVYALRRPDPWPRKFGFHEIFHVLVIAGSLSHYWVMYRYVTLYGA
jgi:hemolysin III